MNQHAHRQPWIGNVHTVHTAHTAHTAHTVHTAAYKVVVAVGLGRWTQELTALVPGEITACAMPRVAAACRTARTVQLQSLWVTGADQMEQ
jgi:hypothetical protein|eukprot:COSAG01_NODE_34134_length_552_cov_7.487859_1_plen_91_part_00